MLPNNKIKEIMSSDIVTVRPTDIMMKVREIFETNDFHHVPVVDDEGRLLGIISKLDYNKVLNSLSVFNSKRSEFENQRILKSMLASDVMTTQVAKLHPDDTIMVAVGIFKENLFHALPIVNDENKIVGMLSTFDLLNYAFDEKRLIGTM